MNLRILLCGGLTLAVLLGLRGAPSSVVVSQEKPSATQEQPVLTFKQDILPFLSKHCFACHGNGKKTAGLAIDKYKDDAAVQKDRQMWENIAHMIRTGEMPPKEKPRPPGKEIEAALAAIESVMNRLDCSKEREVGHVGIRRLNRTEYQYTIRDLLGVTFNPTADFPADDAGLGFDNSISPLLLEKYLTAAEEILDKVIVVYDPPKPGVTRISTNNFRVSPFGAGEIPKAGGGPMKLYGKGEIAAFIDADEADYLLRTEVSAQHAGDEPVRGAIIVGGSNIKEFEIKTDQTGSVKIQEKVRLKAGKNRIGVAFLNPFSDPKVEEASKKQRQLNVRYLEWDGPYNPKPPKLPETHRKLFEHKPGLPPREAAHEIVGRFATRAFRRPVAPEEVERLLSLYDKATKQGERFENAVRLSLFRVLVSPHFLYRVELDPPDAKPGKAYPINEYALATRLSYFLWSTMPDDELFALAGKGELRNNLEPQVKRMLKDPKSIAFVHTFGSQWLTLRNLATVSPDPKAFPGFDEELRSAMQRETELFFEAILREDRSILDFIDADFTFLNEKLAKHYGIEGVKGKEFQRVKVPPSRGGILTHASILTLTSYPTRTSPVQRGKWVLEQILNTPPPAPPEDVPEIGEDHELKGSLRQVMEMHRKNPLCASCHQRMDPIGFAFENYDAIGRWRDKDGKFDIDSSGVLPDGKSFKGPAELKAILKDKKDLFSRCLTDKILTYAIGRSLEYYDKCAVDDVVRALARHDYRFSALVVEIVRSEPFQKRTAALTKGDKK
jgi:hypothetical protein